MPYEMPIAEIAAVLGVIAAQAIGLWKIIDARFARMEATLESKVAERRSEMAAHMERDSDQHEQLSSEVARIDRDLSGLKSRVDSLPTREQMSDLLDKRMDKLEGKFDRLYAALVRPPAFMREDNGA